MNHAGQLAANQWHHGRIGVGVADADMPPPQTRTMMMVVESQAAVPSASGKSVGMVKARAWTRSSSGSGAHAAYSLPTGNKLANSCRALPLTRWPSSGSLAVIAMKFLASFSVMCGGNGGTFGSV